MRRAYSATAPSIVPGKPLSGGAFGDLPHVDREHLSAGLLDSAHDLALGSQRAKQSIEVRGDDNIRLARLDSLDCSPQAGPAVERGATAHVELVEGLDERQPVALASGRDPLALLVRGCERLALPALYLRHPDDSYGLAHYDAPMIEPGDVPPDFELPDQDGRAVKLSDFRGENIVLYFYPKAATPGCTTQACGVRDHRSDYAAANATVLGISPDSVAKVKKFHDAQDLNFALLADADHAVADAYGVWVEKSMYGRTYMGNERTTFVIGADGRVAEVLRKVKPALHDAQVLDALRGTGSSA